MLHSLAWKYQQGIHFADPYMSWTLMIHKLLCLFSLLILTTILQGKWFYYSVTQKGNSALHDYAICPRSHSSKCQSWNLNPDLYDFKDPSTSALLSPKPTENLFFSPISYQTCIPVISTLMVRIRNIFTLLIHFFHSFTREQSVRYNLMN